MKKSALSVAMLLTHFWLSHTTMPYQVNTNHQASTAREDQDQSAQSVSPMVSSEKNLTLVTSENFCLFVLRFYGPVNPMGVMSSVVNLPNHTFTGQA